MFKDTIHNGILLIFCLFIFYFALPEQQIKDFQVLASALVALFAAVIAYFGSIDSIREKQRLESKQRDLEKIQHKHKLSFFLLSDLSELDSNIRVWKEHADTAIESGRTSSEAKKILIKLLQSNLDIPPLLEEPYQTFYVLDEKIIASLSRTLFSSKSCKRISSVALEDKHGDIIELRYNLCYKKVQLLIEEIMFLKNLLNADIETDKLTYNTDN